MHIIVQTGRGAEATAIISGGGEGGHIQGFQILLDTPGDGNLLPIPGTGDLGSSRQLDGSGNELVPGESGVEEDEANPQHGGGGAASVWIIFQRRGAGGAALWIGYLSGHPPHGKGSGGVSGPGGNTADGAATMAET